VDESSGRAVAGSEKDASRGLGRAAEPQELDRSVQVDFAPQAQLEREPIRVAGAMELRDAPAEHALLLGLDLVSYLLDF
jgi:hypothetical protein